MRDICLNPGRAGEQHGFRGNRAVNSTQYRDVERCDLTRYSPRDRDENFRCRQAAHDVDRASGADVAVDLQILRQARACGAVCCGDRELCLNLGDALHQAARLSVSLVTSTPSLNLIPSMTFGN